MFIFLKSTSNSGNYILCNKHPKHINKKCFILYDYSSRKLRVFENMVLRRIFGPRSDEVTGEWRRLHNEQLNDL